MAELITLTALTAIVDPLVVTDDFIELANRAAQRLYSRGAAPGYMIEAFVGGSAITIPEPVGPGIQPVGGTYIILPIEDYDHVAKFRWLGVGLNNLVGCQNLNTAFRDIIPVDAKFSEAGYDRSAFVDHGDINGSGDHYYEIPVDLVEKDLTNLTALVRKTYIPVVIGSDVFPFTNLDALKMAVLAIVYEEENDTERASNYWSDALKELESDSGRYRGPQVINISYYDPASAQVTTTIN